MRQKKNLKTKIKSKYTMNVMSRIPIMYCTNNLWIWSMFLYYSVYIAIRSSIGSNLFVNRSATNIYLDNILVNQARKYMWFGYMKARKMFNLCAHVSSHINGSDVIHRILLNFSVQIPNSSAGYSSSFRSNWV